MTDAERKELISQVEYIKTCEQEIERLKEEMKEAKKDLEAALSRLRALAVGGDF